MSALQRPTPAASARLRTGGDCLRHANRLFKSAGVAHGQGFVNAEEESLTLMGHATGKTALNNQQHLSLSGLMMWLPHSPSTNGCAPNVDNCRVLALTR